MIEIKESDGIYVAVTTIFTETILRMFPKINRSRFGLVISMIVGISLCIFGGYEEYTIIQNIIKGIMVAGLASGLFDGVKTVINWKGNKT